MCSRFLERVRLFGVAMLLACSHPAVSRDLVVCADPDNLPFSHQDGSGFENRIAELVAQDLGAHLVYRWQPLRRGVVRKTLGAGLCDVLMGVPADPAYVATTIPYYRSSYALATRKAWGAPVRSFDDPRLRTSRIGVPLIGADGAAAPPALALARQGIFNNVTGFPVYGATPIAQRMVDALANGEIDVALVWGPTAAYYARRAKVPIELALAPDDDSAPESFAIAIAVRDDERALRDDIDTALVRDRSRIDAVLIEYGVPLQALDGTAAAER
ncbi:MAG TPA: quinoprotein dehydrogenase-associated putative ABC transporter substrate-binding protein [Casimicrobiaceae bacterium]|jgi:mxaJ protein|nr:quinoprotein dehydrogenase-associated putative ABC transporter substrate-binding protein [Casimicrobiaceae bacterium]